MEGQERSYRNDYAATSFGLAKQGGKRRQNSTDEKGQRKCWGNETTLQSHAGTLTDGFYYLAKEAVRQRAKKRKTGWKKTTKKSRLLEKTAK
mmetsp:Transcript_21968/g.43590  ORF Transcript_21968/g.43590 Transcript_21968/m.43590 type:complete len:92 (-) Transcript_21968:2249-2524(-)